MRGGTGYLYGKSVTNSLTEQWTFGNPSIRPMVFAQWSQGYLVRLGITQRLSQNIAYIWWSHVLLLYYLQSVCPVVPPVFCTTDSNVRSPDLVYVRLLRVNVWLLFSKGSKCYQVNAKGFGSR
jgi:hypothetical protein